MTSIAPAWSLAQLEALDFEPFLRQCLGLVDADRRAERDALCDFRRAAIPFGESYLDSLMHLYKSERLSDEARARFHAAVVSLFRNARPEDFPVKGMQDLLYLITLMRTRAGLQALAPVLGSGAWGERYPRLIYDAMTVFKEHPSSDDTYDAARDLATSVNFDDRFVFEAYETMIAVHPQDWLADLEKLSDRFERLTDRLTRDGDARKIERLEMRVATLAERMTRSITLRQLQGGLRTFNASRRFARLLARSLFQEGGPLELEAPKDEEDAYTLSDRRDPARVERVTLPVALRYLMIKWKIGGHRGQIPSKDGLLVAAQTRVLNLSKRRVPAHAVPVGGT
jgi:hypothetical protein